MHDHPIMKRGTVMIARIRRILRFAPFILGMFVVSSANAATTTATINGTAYNFSTVYGSYGNLTGTLQQQPWWGSADTAAQFTTGINTGLGMPNDNGYVGPVFAYAEAPNGNPVLSYWAFRGPLWTNVTTLGRNIDVYFAVASPVSTLNNPASVPEIDAGQLPVAAFLFLTMLLRITSRRMRRGDNAACYSTCA